MRHFMYFISIVIGCTIQLSSYAQENKTGNVAQQPEAKSEEIRTLFGDAAKTPVISAGEVGLKNPRTVFVPGRYTQAGRGALFLSDSKVVVPSARTDLLGFISSGNGVIVANYETAGQTSQIVSSKANAATDIMTAEDIAKLTPEQKLRLIEAQAKMSGGSNQAITTVKGDRIVFYFIDANGNVSAPIHVVPTLSKEVWVTDNAIYAATPTGKWKGSVQLYGFIGVDASRKIVTGPQDVSYATPVDNGQAWLVTKPITGESPQAVFSAYQYGFYRWSASGAMALLRRESDQYTTLNSFVNTTGAFVDAPNKSDSLRTGYVMRAYGVTRSATTNDFFSFSITPYSFTEPLPTRTQIDCFGLCNRQLPLIGHHPLVVSSRGGAGRSIDNPVNAAIEAAQRAVLFKSNDKVQFGSQERGKDGLYYELVSLPSREVRLGYQVMGSGMNLFRSLVGENKNNISFHLKNDVFALFTSKGTVLVEAESMNTPNIKAFHVESGQLVNPIEIADFLNKHGFDGQ